MSTETEALRWEEVARALAEELEEANEYIAAEHDFSYWRGYDDAKGWAWLWFGLFIAVLIAWVVTLVLS